jgi:hypothetical protein
MAPNGVDVREAFALGVEGDNITDGREPLAPVVELGGGAGVVEPGGGAGTGEGRTRKGPGAQDQPSSAEAF